MVLLALTRTAGGIPRLFDNTKETHVSNEQFVHNESIDIGKSQRLVTWG